MRLEGWNESGPASILRDGGARAPPPQDEVCWVSSANLTNGRDNNPGHGDVDGGLAKMSRKHPLALLRQFLPEFLQPLSARIAGIDVAVVVHADAFESAGVFGFLDESGDLAVLGAADPDALLEAGVGLVGRLRVGDIDAVIL